MQATVQPQEAYPERAGVGGGRTRKDTARAPSAATISSPPSTTVARAITATAFDALTWVGPLHPMSFGSLRLNQPMTYFFDSRCGLRNEEPAAIDVALPIAQHPYHPVEGELTYWPTYTGLTPGQRRNYLEWLAGGPRTGAPELGYKFLFFYGLGRREFVVSFRPKGGFGEI